MLTKEQEKEKQLTKRFKKMNEWLLFTKLQIKMRKSNVFGGVIKK